MSSYSAPNGAAEYGGGGGNVPLIAVPQSDPPTAEMTALDPLDVQARIAQSQHQALSQQPIPHHSLSQQGLSQQPLSQQTVLSIPPQQDVQLATGGQLTGSQLLSVSSVGQSIVSSAVTADGSSDGLMQDDDDEMDDGATGDQASRSSRARSGSIQDASKKRRSRKGLGKRYMCQCGRGYSRAEHLSRHQLNHKPKEIYYCDHPGCDRTFVREDLCKRHKLRHLRGNADSDTRSADRLSQLQAGPATPAMASQIGSVSSMSRQLSTVSEAAISCGVKAEAGGRSTPSPQQTSTQLRPALAPPFSPARYGGFGPGGQPHHLAVNGAVEYAVPVIQYQGASQPTASAASILTGDGALTETGSLNSFGGLENSTRSPGQLMPDDFTAWLLSSEAQRGAAAGVVGSAGLGFHAPFFAHDSAGAFMTSEGDGLLAGLGLVPGSPALPLEPAPTSTPIPESRRIEVLRLLSCDGFEKNLDVRFGSNVDEDGHVLSLGMMQRYLDVFWHYLNPQLPIVHLATFSAADCPTMLLAGMIMMGAGCIEKRYGLELTTQSADLGRVIASGLRWQLFQSADFGPPAPLWVLQTLLLLEVFEKQLSSRALHERAHVHHATTLTLMRRGSSLDTRDDDPAEPVHETDKTRWRLWAAGEATRRVAFTAFVLDALHASMFGHQAVLAAHELRLPLPCDDALWSAPTAAEAVRVRGRLTAVGLSTRPVFFLDALRGMLGQQPVEVTGFGRMVLMAGLLSVAWQLQHRDLQARSLGNSGQGQRWRSVIIRGVDFWLADSSRPSRLDSLDLPLLSAVPVLGDEESRAVLYALARISIQADVVDAQILAGASRLLGRSVTPVHYSSCRNRLTAWAGSTHGRASVFAALSFLSTTLLSDSIVPSPSSSGSSSRLYSARGDMYLHRPWTIYVAVLTVWAFGFVLDGPVGPSRDAALLRRHAFLEDPELALADMREFFSRMGVISNGLVPTAGWSGPNPASQTGWEEPSLHRRRASRGQAESPAAQKGTSSAAESLASRPGRNQLLGMLMLAKLSLQTARWELMSEASRLLDRASGLLCGLDLADVQVDSFISTGPA